MGTSHFRAVDPKDAVELFFKKCYNINGHMVQRPITYKKKYFVKEMTLACDSEGSDMNVSHFSIILTNLLNLFPFL
jgi:hypothetical protein